MTNKRSKGLPFGDRLTEEGVFSKYWIIGQYFKQISLAITSGELEQFLEIVFIWSILNTGKQLLSIWKKAYSLNLKQCNILANSNSRLGVGLRE